MQMQQPPSSLHSLPCVQISEKGTFKYILIRVYVEKQPVGYLVRGSTKYAYHSQNYTGFLSELKSQGYQQISQAKPKSRQINAKKSGKTYRFICEGGGRIEHHVAGKVCLIYGYSKTYGRVDHAIAKKIVESGLAYHPDDVQIGDKEY